MVKGIDIHCRKHIYNIIQICLKLYKLKHKLHKTLGGKNLTEKKNFKFTNSN